MGDKDINLLIEKFWMGTASEDEKKQLDTLLQESGNEIAMESYTEFGQSESAENWPEEKRKTELLQVIGQEIEHRERDKTAAAPNRSVKNTRLMVWVATAAMIILAASIGFRFFTNTATKPLQHALSVLHYDTIFNGSQKIKSIQLPDNSTILLYPKSQICFEHNFNQRNLQLAGKASFKVKHDINNIFTVKTGQLVTTDIGTEFEIDATGPRKITVRLVEGKIKVGIIKQQGGIEQNRFLTPGETITFDKETGQFATHKSSVGQEENKLPAVRRLTFDKAPLETVFKEIAHRYKTKIIFDKTSVANLSFSGTVEPGDSLPAILSIICYMNNLKASTQQNVYTIVKQ